MEFKKVIDNRHSVRGYEKKGVPKSILKEIIKDASKAPSSMNSQPWEFHVVISKNIREKISKLLNKALKKHKKEINKLKSPLKKIITDFYKDMGNCQNIIFVYIPKNKRESDMLSASLAIENLMLSATARGLGTCWAGTLKDYRKEINKILKVNNKELMASILIGYPKKGFKPLKRSKKKLNEILKFR